MIQLSRAAGISCLLVAAANLSGSDLTTIPHEFDPFRPLIGEWRGVGQVRRGSSRGAWKETAEWRYDFNQAKPRLILDVADGQHVDKLILSVEGTQLMANLVTPDGEAKPATITSTDPKTTVFVTENSQLEATRLTLTQLNDKRTLLLIESKPASSKIFRRLGEVGYTRAGTRLASDSSNGPECIVTGGKGTIKVSHNGRTYYVCCTGCKQAFEADPDAIIADAAARMANEQ